MKPSIVRVMQEVARHPVDDRRRGVQQRAASMWLRGLALGFLLAISSSFAVLFYDWLARRQAQANAD